jgi:glucose/arabinose dehydrogenase
MNRSGRPTVLATALVAGLLVAGCGVLSDSESATTGTTKVSAPVVTSSTVPVGGASLPPPIAVPTLAGIALKTEQIADVYEPIALAPRNGTDTLYVAQKDGKIKQIRSDKRYDRDGNVSGSTYRLDISPIFDIGRATKDEGERGLLGLTFSSDGRRMYLLYTAAATGNITVDGYLMNEDAVDRSTKRTLLDVPHPEGNHNGGQLVMGPDGFLYIGMGDGGGEGDPNNHAQDPRSLYGKILRIDPEGGTKDTPYDSPAGNPYHDGANGAPEVWAIGLRNPWRFSFDRFTKDLWIGDVGQGAWEEIDFAPNAPGGAGRGANFGWNVMEGSHPVNGATAPPPGYLPPVFDYGHDQGGCAVVGGYSYRGRGIPSLIGVYVYGDYCAGEVRGFLRQPDNQHEDAGFGISVPKGKLESGGAITSFGEDNDGELFVLSAAGGVYKIAAA